MIFFQFHQIRNFPASNLNRGENGEIKTVSFGDVMRARISSQCFKRAIRTNEVFRQRVTDNVSIRTRRVPSLVRELLASQGIEDKEMIDAIALELRAIGKGESKGKGLVDDFSTNQVIAVTTADIRAITRQMVAAYPEIKGKVDGLAPTDEDLNAVDLALFGRFSTSTALRGIDAACQVAHLVSVNECGKEVDYFTAVDDLADNGSGMIGNRSFAAPCHYSYVNLDYSLLLSNLNGNADLAKAALVGLVESMIFATPTGMQNSFAAHTLPSFVMVEASQRKLPVSYVNAFLQPVRSTTEGAGYAEGIDRIARDRMLAHMQEIDSIYGIERERVFFPDAQTPTLVELLNKVEAYAGN